MDHKLRSKGIGGSEVAAILGISEWSSPYQVWLEKTGRDKSNEDNKWMYAGRLLESAVAKYFSEETGYRVIKSSAESKTYQHPVHTFAVGTPDRTYFGLKGAGKGILECKTTQKHIDNVPMSWFAQLQWYLGVTDLTFGSIAWLERGVDFGHIEYEFDKNFWEYALTAVGEFWENHVVKDVPPDPINTDDITKMYATHTAGKVVYATPEVVERHKKLKTLVEAQKELERQTGKLVEEIKLTMGDAEAIVDNGGNLFTWKSSKSSLRVDNDKLRELFPDVYNKCLKEVSGGRRFLIK